MLDLKPKSNITNKVRNTTLPKTKPLLPLFETISNSIHAIDEAEKSKQLSNKGKIIVNIIRQGDSETLAELPDNDCYPVKSFEIIDNGIGFTDENVNFFVEADTDHKVEIGGKGVGRFVCLKAFKKIKIDSCFWNGTELTVRKFEYVTSKDGINNFIETKGQDFRERGTKLLLEEYRPEYVNNLPREITVIAREIVNHFLLYFIQTSIPQIIIRNQNNIDVDCSTLYAAEFKNQILTDDFILNTFTFKVYLTKSYKLNSHKIHFCAHNRSVREEGLYNKIPDLGKLSIKDGDIGYYYQAYVVSKFLDDNVNQERVGFNFPNDDDEDDNSTIEEITLAKIRNQAIETIEKILSEYLSTVRENKINNYKPTINNELPQYKTVFKNRIDDVKRLPPNLPKNKLDIALYKIESDWKIEVKEEGLKLKKELTDIKNFEQYKNRYEKYLTEFNEIGQVDLARYVVHRKAVIDLLEDFLNKNTTDSFNDEDIIHSIFFPIKSSSDEVAHDKRVFHELCQ